MRMLTSRAVRAAGLTQPGASRERDYFVPPYHRVHRVARLRIEAEGKLSPHLRPRF